MMPMKLYISISILIFVPLCFVYFDFFYRGNNFEEAHTCYFDTIRPIHVLYTQTPTKTSSLAGRWLPPSSTSWTVLASFQPEGARLGRDNVISLDTALREIQLVNCPNRTRNLTQTIYLNMPEIFFTNVTFNSREFKLFCRIQWAWNVLQTCLKIRSR
jgi:hypothetical protein